jgi:hypothetical protein
MVACIDSDRLERTATENPSPVAFSCSPLSGDIVNSVSLDQFMRVRSTGVPAPISGSCVGNDADPTNFAFVRFPQVLEAAGVSGSRGANFAPLAQSDRASGVMPRKAEGLNPSGRSNFTGRSSKARQGDKPRMPARDRTDPPILRACSSSLERSPRSREVAAFNSGQAHQLCAPVRSNPFRGAPI